MTTYLTSRRGILLHGVDVAAYGFELATPTGWLDAPGWTRQTLTVVQRQGVVVSAAPQEPVRKLTLAGTLIGNPALATVALRAAALRTQLDALKAVFADGAPVTLTLPDEPTRYLAVSLDTCTVQPGPGPALVADKLGLTLALTASDPYRYDLSATTVSGSGALALPLGSAPVRPVITMTLPAVGSITFTLTNSAGTTVGTFTLTGALTAGAALVIDCDALTVTMAGATAIALLASGDFFRVTPVMADLSDPLAPVWPTITAGGGASCTVTYHRAWR